MKITNSTDIDAQQDNASGFVWITFKKSDKEFTLQACLSDKKCLEEDDDGMNAGICSDVNNAAFKEFGIDECRAFFYQEIRKIGICII